MQCTLVAQFLYNWYFSIIDIDDKETKRKLKGVLTKHHADLSNACQHSHTTIADELLQVGIITDHVQTSPTYDSMIGNFQSGMRLRSTQSELEEYCGKFLEALSNVGGPVADAADKLQEEWTLAVEGQLQFEYSGKRTKK